MSLTGKVDLAGHLGGLAGGLTSALALFPGIKPKPKQFMLAGIGSLTAYLLTMFLIFYL